nr:T9SS type A sorting domain-containing protein [uncultured Psychroserpens sp.]
MKSYYYTLSLLFFTITSIGQSKQNLKFQLTNTNLKSFTSTEYVLEHGSGEEISQSQEHLINFNPVILFNDDNDYLSVLTDIDKLSQLTVFTVYNIENNTVNKDIWKIYGEDSFVVLRTDRANNSDMYLEYEKESKKEPLLNTYTQMYRPKATTSYEQEPHVLLGDFSHTEASGFKGSIAEVLIYNKVLRGKKKQIVETALALKYGITLTNGKDYLSSSKDKIYNLKGNDIFKHRIAGIGRDDKSNLLQKQSHSTKENSLITVGLGDIVSTNKENSTSINDQSFIIWADNDQDPILDKNNQVSQVSLMKRQWKVQVTGMLASELSTQLKFDTSSIFSGEGKANEYLLVIDPSGEGSFISEKVKYIDISLIDDNSLTFNNIKWDEDGSGSDVFTFALKSELEIVLEEVAPLNCKTNNNAILSYEVQGGMPPYYFELSKNDNIIDHWKSTDIHHQDNHIKQLTEGKYTLKAIDALQTKVEVDYTLELPQAIAVNLGEDRRLSLDNLEIILDASATSNEKMNYIWTSSNGFTSNSPQIQVNEPGAYTITITTENGCTASDTIKIKDSIITSFILFPNQSRDGNYTIQVKLSKQEDITIKVFDITGRQLSTIKGKNKSMYSIPGQHISAAGIYNVVLESASQNESRKLIID